MSRFVQQTFQGRGEFRPFGQPSPHGGGQCDESPFIFAIEPLLHDRRQLRCDPTKSSAISDREVHPGNPLSRVTTASCSGAAPQFLSTTYGDPDYARLTDDRPDEIAQGAADSGELGVYHDEFFAQRAAHLRTRLEEFIPAGSDAELIFLT